MAGPRGGKRDATSADQQLDVVAVVKASQALSSEMLLPRLIERLMTIALQNAGADRGLLILPHESDYRIEAEARADGEKIVLHYGPAAGPAAPEAIIRYVMRTQESVILDDAAKPESLLRRSVLGSSATAIDPLPSNHSSRRTGRIALPGERTGFARLHAGSREAP